jgi:hypothetical protein
VEPRAEREAGHFPTPSCDTRNLSPNTAFWSHRLWWAPEKRGSRSCLASWPGTSATWLCPALWGP